VVVAAAVNWVEVVVVEEEVREWTLRHRRNSRA
jgi:hypothetical protein